MSDLPAELSRWEPELAVLPRELALGLGPLVVHLARELGPLGSRPLEVSGEPDGYDGLSRRGNYERLASTEWLYALELPEEFLRRAVFGEQSFLHLRLREPAGVRRSVALFDAGPGQLGGPRIAQLALLVALARRAQDQGAAFEWGLLQGDELQRGFSKSSVLHLLQGRSAREPVAADLERWRDLVEGAREPDDLWLAGSERLADLDGAEGTSILAVRDVVEPKARRLAVEVRRPASSVHRAWSATISLDLPAPDACVRLLRDPFEVVVPAPGYLPGWVHPECGIHFSANGGWLVVRLIRGALLVHAIPNSPREKSDAGPRVVREAMETALVAIGLRGSRLAFAHVEGTDLRVEYFSKYGSTFVGHETSPVAPRPMAGKTPGALYWDESSSVLIDAVGQRFERHAGRWEHRGDGIAASAVRRGRVVTIEPATDTPPGRKTVLVNGDEMRISLRYPFFGRVVAFYGFPRPVGPGPGELVALMVAPGIWAVHTKSRCFELHAPSGSRVCGVAEPERGKPGLLLLEDGVVSLAGGCPSQRLGFPARIAAAAASPYRPVVAAIGKEGQLYVWSLQYRALVLQLEREPT